MCSRFLLFLRLWTAFWPLHSCGSVQTAVFYCGLSGFTVGCMVLACRYCPVCFTGNAGCFSGVLIFPAGLFPLSPAPGLYKTAQGRISTSARQYSKVSDLYTVHSVSEIFHWKLIASPTGLCGNPCRGGYYPPVSADSRISALFSISTGQLTVSPAKSARCAARNSFCRASPFPCLARL